MSNEEFCKEEYKQLSEDWRSRDRMTWQMPAFLVVIGGLLLVSAFSQLGNDPTVKNMILSIGMLFSWITTTFLTRNIYLQGLGQKLLKEIKDAITNDCSREGLAEIIQRARRVPLHTGTGEYRFWSVFFRDFITPLSSVCLLSLCTVITGVFFQLLWGLHLKSWFMSWFLWGILASVGNIMLVFALSHLVLNNVEIVNYRGWKSCLRFIVFLVILAPIISIIIFGYF